MGEERKSPGTGSFRLNGFWPKLGPFLVTIIFLLLGSIGARNLTRLDSHDDRLDEADVWIATHPLSPHGDVQARLDELERWREQGGRCTAEDCDDLAKLVQQVIRACGSDTASERHRLLDEVDSDARVLRARVQSRQP